MQSKLKKKIYLIHKKFRIEIHAQGGHDLHIKYSKWFALKVTQFINENLEKK